MVEAASTNLDPTLSQLRKLRKKLFNIKKLGFPRKVAFIWTFTVPPVFKYEFDSFPSNLVSL
jgi:hypothetical protein